MEKNLSYDVGKGWNYEKHFPDIKETIEILNKLGLGT